VRYLVVGVVRDGLPYPEHTTEVWTPFDLGADDLSEGMRGARYLDVVARLREGATLDGARTELDGFVRGLADEHPMHEGHGATATALREDLVRPFVGILKLLLASAGLFLLIACANVAGLVATRRVRDARERGLRLALGGSRWRVLRQEVAEMLVLVTARCRAPTSSTPRSTTSFRRTTSVCWRSHCCRGGPSSPLTAKAPSRW
jgi:hypothetical protein